MLELLKIIWNILRGLEQFYVLLDLTNL